MNADTLKPMLAKDVHASQFRGDVIVQPKLDGVRAVWDPATSSLRTRNGREINSCPHIINDIYAQGLQHLPLDGEIYCRELPFESINGLVRRQQPEAASTRLQFHVFDVITGDTARQRAEWISQWPGGKAVKPMATFFIDAGEINDYYQLFLDSDCEGLIVRDPDARYQPGKSDALGRIKPVYDMEATLIGFEKTTSAHNRDTFGSLILQLPTGKTFKCSGLTRQQRQHLWQKKPYGAAITVLFKGLTPNGLPREPRFKAIRTDLTGVAA